MDRRVSGLFRRSFYQNAKPKADLYHLIKSGACDSVVLDANVSGVRAVLSRSVGSAALLETAG